MDPRGLDLLKGVAKKGAEFRGHTMGNFRKLGLSSYVSKCRVCQAEVIINMRPAPNEIGLVGEAVSLTCPI